MAWRNATLGEVAPLSYGKALPEAKRAGGDVPVFGSNGIVGWHDSAIVKNPSVVIGRKGSVGALQFSEVPSWPIDTAFFTEGSSESDIRFLSYLFTTLPLQESSDSAVPGLNRDYAHSLTVRIPELPEQKAIAYVLGMLDEKIRVNQQIASTLEQISQTVFKSWFVDFDPVNAKARGEQPVGMDAETAALFPNSFEDSELGPIPSGWDVLGLGKVVDLTWGDTKTTKATYVESGHRAFSAKGQDGYLEKFDYDQPGIVLSAIGAGCGKTWLALGKWSCIKNTIRLIANSEYENAIPYVFYLTNKVDFWEKRGSAQPFIGQEDSRQKTIVVPTKPLLEKFEVFSMPIFKQLHEIEIQNICLSQIRDTLLPRLISGELEIPAELLEA